jgi:glycosyltransferase involved in cell wall biosynthesis
MKINILTARFGGPFQWGKDLTLILKNKDIAAQHFHTLSSLAKCTLYQDADIVHTTVPFPFKLWQKPTILTIHGDYTVERNAWQRYYPKTIAQAEAITVPSEYLKQRLGLEKAIVVPNALFPDRFKPVRHGARDELSLVSIMNFHFPDKVQGLLKIIEILSKLKNHRFKYTIIGGGSYLDRIKQQVAETKVAAKFTGFLPDSMPHLATSDIFLYYSHHDNFPIVLLEAMASGLPIITNDVGAVNEIIEDQSDGYITTNDDAYLECLLNLANDVDLRTRLGQNARRSVETKFNWTKIVSRYVEIYERMI